MEIFKQFDPKDIEPEQIHLDARNYLFGKPTSDSPNNTKRDIIQTYQRIKYLTENPESGRFHDRNMERTCERLIGMIQKRHGSIIALKLTRELPQTIITPKQRRRIEDAAASDFNTANNLFSDYSQRREGVRALRLYESALAGYRLLGERQKYMLAFRKKCKLAEELKNKK